MRSFFFVITGCLFTINAFGHRLPEFKEALEHQDIFWSVSGFFKTGEQTQLNYLMEKDFSQDQWDKKLSYKDKLKCKFHRFMGKSKNNRSTVSGSLRCEAGDVSFRVGPAQCKTDNSQRSFQDRDNSYFDYETKDFKAHFRILCNSIPHEKYRNCKFEANNIEKLDRKKLDAKVREINQNHCEDLILKKIQSLKNPGGKVIFVLANLSLPECSEDIPCVDPKIFDQYLIYLSQSCVKGFQEACYREKLSINKGEEGQLEIHKQFCEKGFSDACSMAAYFMKNKNLDAWNDFAKKGCNGGDNLGCILIKTDETAAELKAMQNK